MILYCFISGPRKKIILNWFSVLYKVIIQVAYNENLNWNGWYLSPKRTSFYFVCFIFDHLRVMKTFLFYFVLRGVPIFYYMTFGRRLDWIALELFYTELTAGFRQKETVEDKPNGVQHSGA